MANDRVDITPINSGVLNGISIDELEDRLEMQMLGLLDVMVLACASTTNCPRVNITCPDVPGDS